MSLASLSIDWSHIATSVATLVVCLVARVLLDYRLGVWVVRLLFWIPVRGIFRDAPTKLSGQWESEWASGGSKNYSDPNDRHSRLKIKQFGRYIYTELTSRGEAFGFFGRIYDNYVVGDWFNKSDPLGYFGAYQLRIVNSSLMEGKWIGHSKAEILIRVDDITWTKLKP